jgi:hypothetical protein
MVNSIPVVDFEAAARWPAAQALAALATTSRPFRAAECAALARRAAALLDLSELPRTQASASFLLWHDEHSVGWLNLVPGRRDTGYHDHDGSAVGVHVIEGSVTNEGLPVGGRAACTVSGPATRSRSPVWVSTGWITKAARSRSTSTRRRSPPSATTRSSTACSSARPDRPTRARPRARGCWPRSPRHRRAGKTVAGGGGSALIHRILPAQKLFYGRQGGVAANLFPYSSWTTRF